MCIDALRLGVKSLDMRAGTERRLARVVQVFGAAQAHHGQLFVRQRESHAPEAARARTKALHR